MKFPDIRHIAQQQLEQLLDLFNQKGADTKALAAEFLTETERLMAESGDSGVIAELMQSLVRRFKMKAAGVLYDASEQLDAQFEAAALTFLLVLHAFVIAL